ncbi:MAG: enoyl-CoA hydratase/isomerase family protein, partial [Pseudomonadota bacterium]
EMEEYLASLAMAAAPGAVHDAKRLVADFAGAQITDALSRESAKRIAARRVSDEGREGLSAFLEKRKPNWAT